MKKQKGSTRRHLLFLFLDGVGLGKDDPATNPFANALMPNLQNLLGGMRLTNSEHQKGTTNRTYPGDQPLQKMLTEPLEKAHGEILVETDQATLLVLDACLGVNGVPQSATGQATLLTGINIPQAIGYHYGPKPDASITQHLKNGNLFDAINNKGLEAALLNAYPPRYFEAIRSGRRLLSAIPLAVVSAGLDLKTMIDLQAGKALAADFTARGWRDHLGLVDTPVWTPHLAGEQLARLAQGYHFSFFEFWLSDYAGHSQDMAQACRLLEEFDQVLGGLLEAWERNHGLLLVTSDHGNLEDLSTRRHTLNPVPALLVGSIQTRRAFYSTLKDLTNVAPAILRFLQ